MERIKTVISGKVQGVFFRANTRKKALEKNVTGWVKNRPDGKVEAVFEGDKKDVEKMVDFCHEGPERARVEKVEVKKEESEGLKTFKIRK